MRIARSRKTRSPWIVRTVESLGATVFERLNQYLDLFGIVAQAIPELIINYHRRSVRNVFWRQLLFTFVDAIPVAIRISTAAGLLLIVQTAMWTESMGSSMQAAWPLIVRITIRDLAPMIASLIVIGRSAGAIATELSLMEVTGETDVIESHGIDPMSYLVMPRIISTMLSVPFLAAIILLVMFASGYVVGLGINVVRVGPLAYLDDVARAISLDDAWFFLPKTFVAGAFIGAICCIEGLGVKTAITETPRVASRASVRSLTAVFVISAILSFLIYGKVLVFDLF